MQKRFFSILSVFFFIMTILLILYIPNQREWENALFEYILEFPFIFGGLGIVSALLGVKGSTKITLILLISIVMVWYLFVYLMGTVGFQEP
ncbi:hypothetical protein JUJ52_03200 [Virgibacillus sp. AGTR]|uniref:hypothetical protein n=1 Tax=Virgibacillus sp. AGTR TaxID=2812055 RepID=UPI001D16C4DE|nr:hypothetical protein [Virgibacillus sp. AGTR]MCC2248965.1 hypothetical protein [Virgibacillus sp. AGTR]